MPWQEYDILAVFSACAEVVPGRCGTFHPPERILRVRGGSSGMPEVQQLRLMYSSRARR